MDCNDEVDDDDDDGTDQWHWRGLKLSIGLHEVGHDVDGDGEDDRAVVLGRDAVQGLQVPQLGAAGQW